MKKAAGDAPEGPPSDHWPEEALDPKDERLLQTRPHVGSRLAWVTLEERRTALQESSDTIFAVVRTFFEREAAKLARILGRQPAVPSEEEIQQAIERAIAEYDWTPWTQVLRPQLIPELRRAFETGAKSTWDALRAANISLTWDSLAPRAVEYAEQRAAELVGMHVLPDGTVVPSQDAKLRIDEYTRAMMRADITRWLEQGDGWSEIARRVRSRQYTTFMDDARARRIARTEASFAWNRGNLSAFREGGITHVQVVDGTQDEICAAVNGQIWDVQQAAQNPLGHPNCSRMFLAVLSEPGNQFVGGGEG